MDATDKGATMKILAARLRHLRRAERELELAQSNVIDDHRLDLAEVRLRVIALIESTEARLEALRRERGGRAVR